MKENVQKILPVLISLVLCIVFGGILLIYAKPMEDVTVDLSLIDKSAAAATQTSGEKGWEVYVREGDTVTDLEPDGRGFYSGIGLGQTLYLSRVLVEEMDAPTLQIGSADRTFVVFLDDRVIYSDWPEQDSRIGYLRLSMSEVYRQEPIIITLPAGYQGKTLTIAQSTPPYAEGSDVKAAPASVILYCGYAYESGIIAESYSLAIVAAALFAVGVLLLIAFLRHRDWSILCIALTAFAFIYLQIMDASFHTRYLGSGTDLHWFVYWLIALSLLACLTVKAGNCQNWMLGFLIACIAVTPGSLFISVFYPTTIHRGLNFLRHTLREILFLLGLATALVLGMKYWRKENRFYRIYAPLTWAALTFYWLGMLLKSGVAASLAVGLADGSFYQLYIGCLIVAATTALICALWDALKTELEQRTEKYLVEQRRELTLASYENLRRQHEEVMMLRHDMLRHFRILHDMGGDDRQRSYLAELIGQNRKIRPIVESGNEMLDIILNGKLSAAVDAGIHVELPHIVAPPELPLSDPDLCALVMNIVDNAITAASRAKPPYIKLKIHEKQGYLGIVCENSFDPQEQKAEAKKETVPKHGLGMKIIQGIVAKHNGVVLEEKADDHFVIKIVIPLL